jgi:formate/nitrite transporter FocA (FNT family)
MCTTGGIVLALGIVLWITVQTKFKKEVQENKTLI